ncbi:hypothetical protein RxyAA322_11100 [Rubrobacter xylanophilus]|uniref:Uncharacterized protein n=1 Tax=Rubrobacter xylanophilus TaxID=49319 RepID=A0A510HGY5_9ACTN|nr:hypothetical protein RxyAA322_11100 [Rubrobacter xylanophilus]
MGYALAASAVVACPCHLAIILPILIGLLGGTALGAALAAHTGLVVAGASAYFVAALAVGLYLAGRKKKEQGPEACRRPVQQPAPPINGREDPALAATVGEKR